MGAFRRSVLKVVVLVVLGSCVTAQPALAWCCNTGMSPYVQRYMKRKPHKSPTKPRPSASTAPVAQTGTAESTAPCGGILVAPSDDVAPVMDRHPAGTLFCFKPGTYKLNSPLVPEDGDRLVGGPGAILNGATTVSHWTSSGSRWVARLPLTATKTDWSGDSLLYPQAVYQEDLFLSGVELTKVGVADGGQVVGESAESVGPGEYFVDYDNDTIYLGSDPSGLTAEVSTTPAAIDSSANDVRISDLVIEKFAGPGIESEGGVRWTIERNEIRFNHTRALKVYGEGRVLNNFVHHNGQYGLTGTGDRNVFEGNEVSFNNAARFARSTESFWDAGGTKFVRNTDLVIRNNNVHDNFGDGIWVDIDNTAVSISGNRVERNYRIGINYEISFGASIEGNIVADNGYVGIWVNSSRDVTLTGNEIARNKHSIVVVQQSRGSEYVTSNVQVIGNTIVNSGVTGTRETTAAVFRDNTYKVASLSSKLWQWDSELLDAAGWKATGMDRDATFLKI